MAFTIKRGDTLPKLRATLQNGDGTPINLTGATVRLILRVSPDPTPGDVPEYRVIVTIIDAPGGVVEYAWLATDTAALVTWNGEFQITFSDGSIQTVPSSGYFQVQVVDSLE